MKALALLSLLALSACVSTQPEPVVVTRDVSIAVPVRCAPKLSPKPAFGDSDAELRAMAGPEDRYQALAVARALHYGWEAEIEAALKGCAG